MIQKISNNITFLPINANFCQIDKNKKAVNYPIYQYNLSRDKVAFTGIKKLGLEALVKKNIDFPDKLYVKSSVLKFRLKHNHPKEVLQDLPIQIGDLAAKRFQYLNDLDNRVVCGSISYGARPEMPKVFHLHDAFLKKNGNASEQNKYDVEWTKLYNSVEELLNKSEKLSEVEQKSVFELIKSWNLTK